jgi:hypothetical protein
MNEHKAWDIFGDLHGHAESLCRLLRELGYERLGEVYRHPAGRRAFFVGDLVDRGPEVRRCVRIVRAMAEAGEAEMVLGNHELNVLRYHTWINGDFLRPHVPKNDRGVRATIESYEKYPEELAEDLQWMLGGRLCYEQSDLRIVHACWDPRATDLLMAQPEARLSPKFLIASQDREGAAFKAIEVALKGHELNLPAGLELRDNEGHVRKEVRVAWWPIYGRTWRDHSVSVPLELDDEPGLEETFLARQPWIYPADERPVFFGHYWLRGPLRCQSANIACLDYSVAKSGRLVAYRWDGEAELSASKMIAVPAVY